MLREGQMAGRVRPLRTEVTELAYFAFKHSDDYFNELCEGHGHEASGSAWEILLLLSSGDLQEIIPAFRILLDSGEQSPTLGGDVGNHGVEFLAQVGEVLLTDFLCGCHLHQNLREQLAEYRMAAVEPVQAQETALPCAHGEQRCAVNFQGEAFEKGTTLPVELASPFP